MSKEQIVGGLFTVLLGVLSLGALIGAWVDLRLSLRGRRADGELVRIREQTYSDGDSRFYPVVAFTPRGGERIEVESGVGKAHPPQWPAASPGSKVGVLYDPARPQRVEVDGYERDGSVMNLLLSAAFAGGAALVFLRMVA
ncbi:DUF3592 domain-containing protein [Actinomadura harenae]|uniref:DUF3592 domain-containing protein n=1 Tax=Actinomadura harenae TaxID=2483351 RepID=A0A3M2M359_9ACTN|nr:DUF3592 domain-containing protein [Actinomadura harenae]RMI42915.1 DUF3592 domain-containing protein [Actinomadura harenae]